MDQYTAQEEAWKRGYEAGCRKGPVWIPVSERLPEDSKPVLCTIWHGEYHTIAVGRVYRSARDNRAIWCMDYPGNVNTVQAWMPLPEAYKGGDGDA